MRSASGACVGGLLPLWTGPLYQLSVCLSAFTRQINRYCSRRGWLVIAWALARPSAMALCRRRRVNMPGAIDKTGERAPAWTRPAISHAGQLCAVGWPVHGPRCRSAIDRRRAGLSGVMDVRRGCAGVRWGIPPNYRVECLVRVTGKWCSFYSPSPKWEHRLSHSTVRFRVWLL